MRYCRLSEAEAVREAVGATMVVVVVVVEEVVDSEMIRLEDQYSLAGPQSDGIPHSGLQYLGAEDQASGFPTAGWGLYLD